MYFNTTISYAMTADGERVRARTLGQSEGGFYFCEGCRGPLLLTTPDDGVPRFVHSLHNNAAVVKAVQCPQTPRERRRRAHQATVTQHWSCIPCRNNWYGSRLCPRCEDGSCAIPAL